MTEKTFAELVAPMADKLILPAKMGLTVKLTPDAAKAQGELVMKLAKIIDAEQAENWSDRNWINEILKCAAFVFFMAGATLLLN